MERRERDGRGMETQGARSGAVREKVVAFGQAGSLLGLLTRAAPVSTAPERPALVILNAGVLHRVGPHRLHVELARRLARQGFSAFRFDLSGIGDSRSLGAGESFRERAVKDVQTAMDVLTEETSTRRFVLLGLCSGADNALATALVDARVAGLVLLDPYAYTTRRAQLRHVARRLQELGPREAAARGLQRGRAEWARRVSGEQATEAARSGRDEPPPAVFEGQLRGLTDRGTPVLAVYTGGLGTRYNRRGQLFESCPALRGHVDEVYFEHADHTFTELDARQRLMTHVSAWLGARYGEGRG